MHTETEIQMIGHVVDGSIEFKMENQKTMFAVVGICDVQSRNWVQYKYTKSELQIGSFSLETIR